MDLSFVVLFDIIIRSFIRCRTKIGLSEADFFFLHMNKNHWGYGT